MNRPKSFAEEFQPERNHSQNHYFGYVPVNFQSEFMYYNPQLIYQNERKIPKSEFSSDIKTCYTMPIPSRQVPKDVFYKRSTISDPYMYRKPCSNFMYEDSASHYPMAYVQYQKYPRDLGFQKYYENITSESGDYFKKQDFCSPFENNEKFEFYDTLAHNNEMYYDHYISEPSLNERNSRSVKHSDIYLQDIRQNASISARKSKQYDENKRKDKTILKSLPQDSKIRVEKSFSVSPQKYINENDAEIKTLYNRDKKARSVSCQTLNFDNLDSTKNHLNQLTQTSELDFTEKKRNLTTTGTQTLDSDWSRNYIARSQHNKELISEKFTESIMQNSIFDEERGVRVKFAVNRDMTNDGTLCKSVGKTNISAFAFDCLQLPESRTSSFFCPETYRKEVLQRSKIKPFIFTGTSR